jgi:hypothetical protein
MNSGQLFHTDIDDAETWIAKAILLGYTFKQHQVVIDMTAWRWSCLNINDGLCSYADWPGRAAKLEVERRVSRENEDVN